VPCALPRDNYRLPNVLTVLASRIREFPFLGFLLPLSELSESGVGYSLRFLAIPEPAHTTSRMRKMMIITIVIADWISAVACFRINLVSASIATDRCADSVTLHAPTLRDLVIFASFVHCLVMRVRRNGVWAKARIQVLDHVLSVGNEKSFIFEFKLLLIVLDCLIVDFLELFERGDIKDDLLRHCSSCKL
jgi:hypothetical protein